MDPPTPRRVRGRSVEDKADARGTRRTRRSNPSKGHAIDRSPRQLTDGIPKGKAWPRSDRPAMLLSERVTAKGNQARQYYLHMAIACIWPRRLPSVPRPPGPFPQQGRSLDRADARRTRRDEEIGITRSDPPNSHFDPLLVAGGPSRS